MTQSTANSSRVLLVYNTCGISGRDNYASYKESIDSIYNIAEGHDIDIILSGCRLSESTKIKLLKESNLFFNFTDEIHPVNVTFNLAVKKMIANRGRYRAYMYIDSGSIFKNKDTLTECLKYIDKYGMVTPQPDKDTEYFGGLGVGRWRGDDDFARSVLFQRGNYEIPIGKGMATHTNLISDSLVEFYGSVYPDIFAGHCTESTFSFINAALQKKWLLLKDIIVEQRVGLDGQSSGFNTGDWVRRGGQTYEHPYRIPSILKRMLTPEAKQYGMGYEECNKILIHDPACYQDNLCLNNNLKYWIKDNLFLKKEELDYDAISCEFICPL